MTCTWSVPSNRRLVLMGLAASFMLLAAAHADDPSPKSKDSAGRPVGPARREGRGHNANFTPSKTEEGPAADRASRRVRELIYVLRLHRVFARTDEWAGAIRELVEIGPAAVPELVRELETTDRDATLRALGFTLRAIGDRRAVPILIRAIPKTLRPPGSDCGVNVADRELFDFMKQYDRSPNQRDHISYGRPVNEIFDALQSLTGHAEPPGGADRDELRRVFQGGSEAEQAEKVRRFEDRQEAWQKWWSDNWRQFVTQAEFDTVSLVPRAEDLVAKAGLESFGPLFPTGAGVKLGPVQNVELDSLTYWDGKSHFDFDTGRAYEYLEGSRHLHAPDDRAFGAQIFDWYRTKGIDARNVGAIEAQDLYIWLIDDGRWETLEEEVRGGQPLELGRELANWLVPIDAQAGEFQWGQAGTFLFTTREGGRGVVKTSPQDEKSAKRRFQYRMFLPAGQDAPQAKTDETPEAPGTPFSAPIKVVLPAPGDSAEYLFDLDTGRRFRLPEDAEPEEAGQQPAIARSAVLLKWCRQQGIELASHTSSGAIGLAKGTPPPTAKNLMRLVGLDLPAVRVRPPAFDVLSVERVIEIMNRPLGEQATVSWMDPWPEDALGPCTWAFETRDGQVGLLQIVETTQQTITFRYRISE